MRTIATLAKFASKRVIYGSPWEPVKDRQMLRMIPTPFQTSSIRKPQKV